MPLVSKCGRPRCFEPRLPGKRYCSEHQTRQEILSAERESARTERRRIEEPWRAIYDTAEWKKCARTCRRRDGFRCVRCGRPGGSTRILSVHHKTRVATLWFRAQEDWESFLAMATNPAVCETLCASCHKDADEELRKVEGAGVPRFARPRTPASQRRRRR